MNYIVLEGISLYLSLIFVFLLVLLSVACLIYAIIADKRSFINQELLKCEIAKNKLLTKANLMLKIKYGEFDENDKKSF